MDGVRKREPIPVNQYSMWSRFGKWRPDPAVRAGATSIPLARVLRAGFDQHRDVEIRLVHPARKLP
jgi:hypothetical protein